MPKRLDTRDKDFEAAFAGFLGARRHPDADVRDAVAAILADVRDRGDAAVIAWSERFDGVTLTPETLRVAGSDLAAAPASCPTEVMEALALAARRIGDFHRRQMPDDLDYVDEAGLRLGQRWTAIAAVGLYVPGGTAAYPSSVLMNAVPAKVASVPRIVMVVPALKGALSPLVLVAAELAGARDQGQTNTNNREPRHSYFT